MESEGSLSCDIWNFHGSEDSSWRILGCDVLQPRRPGLSSLSCS